MIVRASNGVYMSGSDLHKASIEVQPPAYRKRQKSKNTEKKRVQKFRCIGQVQLIYEENNKCHTIDVFGVPREFKADSRDEVFTQFKQWYEGRYGPISEGTTLF